MQFLTGYSLSGVCTAALYNTPRGYIASPSMLDINWDEFTPQKVKVFLWMLWHGCTRMRVILHYHGAIDAPDCPFHASVKEDTDHLFVAYPHLRSL
jgi:hypothetical protein